MIAKRFAAVVAALVAVVGAGGTVTAEARRTEAAAVTPGRPVVGRSAARDVGSAQAGLTNVPSAFSLPPGSNVARLSDQESGASFVLTAPDSPTVLAFYRRQLALGRFTIIADRTEDDATSLAFRDADGWAGAIFATAHQVAVAVKRA